MNTNYLIEFYKIVSKDNKIKTCFNKSFGIIITKYTLYMCFISIYSFKISEHLPFNTKEL